MAQYYKIGDNYYTIATSDQFKDPNGGALPTFQQVSEKDLIGNAGDSAGGTLQGALKFYGKNVQTLDPSTFKVIANPSYLPGVPAVAEGSFGYVALPTTDINSYLGNPIKSTDFQNYLSKTGQTYSPTTGFSGTGANPGSRTLDTGTSNNYTRDANGNVFDAQGNHVTMDQLPKGADGNPLLNLVTLPVGNFSLDSNGRVTSNSGSGGGTGGTNGDVSGALGAVIDGMKNAGLTINPNVPITPASAAEFMAFASANANVFLPYAQKESAPYYANQLKLASDTLGRSLGYDQTTLAQNEKDIQTKYADTLKQIGVNTADQGFAQSGIRNLQESNLAKDTQSTLDQGRRQLAFSEGNQVGNFAQTYGSSNLPSISGSPTPRVLAGQSQFDTSGPSSPFYQLSPDVYNGLTGSNEFAQRSTDLARAGQLESDYNTYNLNSRTLPTPA